MVLFRRRWLRRRTSLSLLILSVIIFFCILKFPASIIVDLEYAFLSTVHNFDGFDNKTGSWFKIVPNIVHFIRFDLDYITYIDYICIKSVHVNQNPTKIFIHSNSMNFSGPYWHKLQAELKDLIEIKLLQPPQEVFGQTLSSLYHSSDVARLHILMSYGGIYLDNDVYVVQNLDRFCHFEMTIGWPEGESLGCQILIAHQNARFLKAWLQSYKYYKPHMWYYNAGHLPTDAILKYKPELIHRVKDGFGVQNLVNELYRKYWPEWQKMFSIHLLSRHRSYLAEDDVQNFGLEFSEFNIGNYNHTFGEMARKVWSV
jgi:hypothetical protein